MGPTTRSCKGKCSKETRTINRTAKTTIKNKSTVIDKPEKDNKEVTSKRKTRAASKAMDCKELGSPKVPKVVSKLPIKRKAQLLGLKAKRSKVSEKADSPKELSSISLRSGKKTSNISIPANKPKKSFIKPIQSTKGKKKIEVESKKDASTELSTIVRKEDEASKQVSEDEVMSEEEQESAQSHPQEQSSADVVEESHPEADDEASDVSNNAHSSESSLDSKSSKEAELSERESGKLEPEPLPQNSETESDKNGEAVSSASESVMPTPVSAESPKSPIFDLDSADKKEGSQSGKKIVSSTKQDCESQMKSEKSVKAK